MKSILRFSHFGSIASIVLMAASCSGGNDSPVNPNPVPPEPETKKMEIRISPSMSGSRATDYGFESGDCIGLFVVNYNGSVPGTLSTTDNYVNNLRFTYTGLWVPDSQIYWKDETTHADFYAYYPYVTITSLQSVTAYPFAVRRDQSVASAYTASDFMVGKTLDVAPSEAAVSIPVSHVMSRIVISLEAGNGFTKESLEAASVSVKINGVKCNSTVDLASGAVTATGEAMTVTPLHADNTYKALIVPQTVAECNLITVTVDGRDFNLKKGFTFESAKSHRFTVTLSKTSSGVNVDINPWIDDGTDNGGAAI